MIMLPEHLEATLNYRERAGWALLPEQQQQWLLGRPEIAFKNGLLMLDQINRGVDGRATWIEGLARLRAFVARTEVVFDWIRAGDLEGLDAMVGVLQEYQSGKLDSTQHTDRASWRLLAQADALWQRLEFVRLDYPGMIALVRAGDAH